VFVPLEAVTDPGQVLAAIARAAGAGLAGTGAPLEALAEMFGDGAWLLVLDNLEQVVQAAPDLLTGAMHQDLPQRARLTGGIDGQLPHHPRRTPRWTSPAI
jgi:predicted ATPase